MAYYEIATAIIVVGIVFIFIALAKIMEKNKVFKILFFMIAMYMCIMVAHYGRLLADANSAGTAIKNVFDTYHTVTLIASLLITGLLLVFFFYDSITWLTVRKKEKQESLIS